ncbi:protein XRI1 [Rhododendron vialii]|uniref:protein XRI1 n=1 Tax=Rhododendron vialii TaxID=182163 RepID=UPI00265F1DBA|nr:protein XRI1 [Rhododendron vialii]
MNLGHESKEKQMGDLHSIAYTSNLHTSSLGWDFHNLGVFNADMSPALMESSSTPPIVSPYDSDFSTGYLQDALFECNDRSKRRRLMLFADHHHQSRETKELVKSYWELNQFENCSENLSYMTQMMTTSFNGISGEEHSSIFREMKTPEEEISASEALDSSSSSYRDSLNTKPSIPDKETLYSLGPSSPSEGGDNNRKKRGVMKRVVYPFALVKPGGVEGDLTLNDINERILMPPTRPVRHPVGDYACRPLVTSPDGPGLSGKAVVAFTKIHTQGRGTITIIRTKG